MHYYRVDLRDLFHPEKPLSPRYVLDLIMHLPLGSCFNAARRGGQQYHGWDAERYALVDIANSLRMIQFLYTSAHIDPKKGRRPAIPSPFPTPDSEAREKAEKANKPGSFVHTLLQAKSRQKRKGVAQ